jgi:transposase
VDLYYAGILVKELSSEYSVCEATIYKRIKEFTSAEEGEDSLTPKEVAAIQNENLRLKQELEILKKKLTSTIFTKSVRILIILRAIRRFEYRCRFFIYNIFFGL